MLTLAFIANEDTAATISDSPQVWVGCNLLIYAASWNAQNVIHFVNNAILNTDSSTDHLGTDVVYLHIAC